MAAYADPAAAALFSSSVRHSAIGSAICGPRSMIQNRMKAMNWPRMNRPPRVLAPVSPRLPELSEFSVPIAPMSQMKKKRNHTVTETMAARSQSSNRVRRGTDSSRLSSTGRNFSDWVR